MTQYQDPDDALTIIGRRRIEKENADLAKLATSELKKLVKLAAKTGLAQEVDILLKANIRIYLTNLELGLFKRIYDLDHPTKGSTVKRVLCKDYFSVIWQHQICPDNIIKIRKRIEAEIKKG
jgi:hypothetical protein